MFPGHFLGRFSLCKASTTIKYKLLIQLQSHFTDLSQPQARKHGYIVNATELKTLMCWRRELCIVAQSCHVETRPTQASHGQWEEARRCRCTRVGKVADLPVAGESNYLIKLMVHPKF